MKTLIFVVVIFICCVSAKKPEVQRSFSLFSVIRFPNNHCGPVADEGASGICLTKEECESVSGTIDGNCASGFGVCCVIYISTCGMADVTKNCSYIVNPGYARSTTEQGLTCNYNIKTDTLKQRKEEICQLRLDFDNFLLVQPITTTGVCNGDTMTVTSMTGENPPVLCGNNVGMHMYVEAGRIDGTAATIAIVTGTQSFERQWKIKVSYIECFSPMRAPTDCVQYFTGTSGVILSYNWLGQTNQIRGMAYQYCFRSELGYCAMEISASSGNFMVTSSANVGRNNCAMEARVEFIAEGGGADNFDQFCGKILGRTNGNAFPSVLRSLVSPFMVGYVVASDKDTNALIGFKIDWRLVAC